MRILVLLHDAFGGHGGIGRFNRDLLEALAVAPGVERVTALPRLIPNSVGAVPGKIDFRRDGLGGRPAYLAAALRQIAAGGYDLVLCGHLRLLPLAWLAAVRCGAPLVLEIYGIDAWKRPAVPLIDRLLGRVDRVLSISRATTERFLGWAGLPGEAMLELPCCVDLGGFAPGPRDPALETRYGLAGKRVIMTFGRLVSQGRAKGMDEVMAVLPELLRRHPDLVYLIAGDGPDRPRLEALARRVGIARQVVFAGRIDEAEKAAHYRLADVYAMPSRGEGFGIVLLEAMASGVPAIGSASDGGRDALRDGVLGALVDPDDPGALAAAIERALEQPKRVPAGLEFYAVPAFRARVAGLLPKLTRRG
jgi:glycosyltransferase involved in cell wall biosynthesis